jgi:hypothetical protein
MVNTDSKEFTHEELKKALKGFKISKHDVPNEKVELIFLSERVLLLVQCGNWIYI